MFYVRRASPLHAARAPVAAAYAVALVTRCWRSRTRSCWRRSASRSSPRRCSPRAGRILLRAALYGGAVRARHRADQPARHRRGADRAAAPRRARPAGQGRRHARGADVRRDPRPARAARRARQRRAARRDRRRRRAAARLSAHLRALGADRRARRAPRAGARPRRAAAGRRAPLPARRDAEARARPSACRSCAPSRRARSIARSTSPRRSRCAATRRPRAAGAAAPARAVVAPRPRLRGVGARRSSRSSPARGCWASAHFDAYPSTVVAAGPREWLLAVAFVVVALAAVRRPPGDRAMSVLRFEARHLPLSARGRAGAARRLGRHRGGRVRRRRRAVGVGQVDVPARGLRARAALPRRRVRRAGRDRRPRHARARPGRRCRRSRARCFRTPRRRSCCRPCARSSRCRSRTAATARARSRAASRRPRSRSGSASCSIARRTSCPAASCSGSRSGAALAGRPRLVLLDEPTSQLDPVAGDELVWLLRRLNEEWGTTIVLVEHRLERCLGAADRVLAFEAGALACDAPPRGFLEWAAERAPALATPGARLFARAGLRPPPSGVKEARATLRAHGLLAEGRGAGRRSRRRRRSPRRSATTARGRRRRGLLRRRPPGRRPRSRFAACGSSARAGAPCCAASTSRSRRASASRSWGATAPASRRCCATPTGCSSRRAGGSSAAGRVALLLQNPNDYFLADRVGEEVGAEALEAGRPDARSPAATRATCRAASASASRWRSSARGAAPPAALCLDEPTRGMDRAAKGDLAADLRAVAARGQRRARRDARPGVRGADVADRVVLLADGRPIADGPIAELLSGGWYFATETARIVDGALLPEDGADILRAADDARGAPVSWQLASFAVLAVALAAGFAWYERARPSAKLLALVATLAALAALGRVAFAPLPSVKPTTDIVLLAGYALGGAPGFVVGAVARAGVERLLRPGAVHAVADGGLGRGRGLRRAAGARLRARPRPLVAGRRVRAGGPRLRLVPRPAPVGAVLRPQLGGVPARRRPRRAVQPHPRWEQRDLLSRLRTAAGARARPLPRSPGGRLAPAAAVRAGGGTGAATLLAALVVALRRGRDARRRRGARRRCRADARGHLPRRARRTPTAASAPTAAAARTRCTRAGR